MEKLMLKNLKGNLFKRNRRINNKKLQYFAEDLKISLEAGLTILEGLEMIKENTNDIEIIRRTRKMQEFLRRGDNITIAWIEAFPEEREETANLIGVYEKSGRITEGLGEIASYIKEKNNTRKKLTEALYYPFIVLIMALIVIMWFLNFFIPSMLEMIREVLIYEDFIRLEDIFFKIRLVVNISLSVVLFLIVFLVIWKEGRKKVLKAISKRKYLGKIVRIHYLEFFTNHFRHLLKSGFSITSALNIFKKMEYFSFYKEDTERVLERLEKGEKLSQGLEEYSFIGKREIEIIKKGEHRGTLSESISYIHQQAKKKRSFYFSEVISFGEPFVILAAGIITGISVYMFYKLIFSYTFTFI